MRAEELVMTWEVSVQQVHELIKQGEKIHLIDVRQPDEHAISRIEGARLIPLSDLPNHIDSIRQHAADHAIITFCHHGGRSLNAAAVLRQFGIDSARSMAGGIDAWSQHVDPSIPRY